MLLNNVASRPIWRCINENNNKVIMVIVKNKSMKSYIAYEGNGHSYSILLTNNKHSSCWIKKLPYT